MALSTLIFPLLAAVFSAVTYLSLTRSQKDVAFQRLGLRRRRRSSRPDTPFLEKQPSSRPLAASTSDLRSTLPPSPRERLGSILPSLSASQQEALGHQPALDQKTTCKRSLLAFEEDYRTADDDKYTPMGFSVREIKALGDFPDYSALCEVPMPKPYVEFDIHKAIPRPYRPLRWAYHQTMSLTKLEPDWWIELESTYKERIAQRQALYAKHGRDVLQWLPGSELACKELMEMVLQFVCARYPQHFSLSADGATFENRLLGTTTSGLRKRGGGGKHPLLILLDNVPEDFALMLRDPESGYYYFRAGVICSSLGWNTGSKIGLRLDQIHGPIPDYKEKMQFSMDRFFSKMPYNKPIQRGSWGLEVDQPLYMPPGDPHEKYRDYQDEKLTRDRLHFRVDWQTLRRLPLSGAVVFNFKGLFTPLTEFRDEPYVPSLMVKILKEGKGDLMKYKNTWHVEHVVIPMLEEYEKEQVEEGLIERDWEVRTLEESPWFPGWEKKWHAQQGF